MNDLEKHASKAKLIKKLKSLRIKTRDSKLKKTIDVLHSTLVGAGAGGVAGAIGGSRLSRSLHAGKYGLKPSELEGVKGGFRPSWLRGDHHRAQNKGIRIGALAGAGIGGASGLLMALRSGKGAKPASGTGIASLLAAARKSKK